MLVTLAFSCEVVHKKLWKSVNICKSYSKKTSGTFFSWTRCMYSRSCGMESCTHVLQFALLCVDLLGGLAAVSVSCRASWPYLFHIYGISSQQSQITLLQYANPLLSCADLFLFFVSIVFFLFWHWSCFTLSISFINQSVLFQATRPIREATKK